MALTLTEILTTPTDAEALAEITQLFVDADWDTTDWKEGTLQGTLLRVCAYVYARQRELAAALAVNSFNSTARGDWLTEFSDSNYDNQRVTGSVTVGDIVLELAFGAGAYTWDPGQLSIVCNDDWVFYNRDRLTLGASTGYVCTGSFAAIGEGPDYNVTTNAHLYGLWQLGTAADGVTVTNPPRPGTSTWITQLGALPESDDSLRERNTLKWSTLATGETTEARVRYAIAAVDSTITDVLIDDSNPGGPGTVGITIAGALDTCTPDQVSVAWNAVAAVMWNASERLTVAAADTIDPTTLIHHVTVWFAPGTDTTALQTDVEGALDAWIASISVGGETYGVHENVANVDRLVDLLCAVDGVSRASVWGDSAETQRAGDPVLVSNGVSYKLKKPLSWSAFVTYELVIQ